jgi:hypothetical protein
MEEVVLSEGGSAAGPRSSERDWLRSVLCVGSCGKRVDVLVDQGLR